MAAERTFHIKLSDKLGKQQRLYVQLSEGLASLGIKGALLMPPETPLTITHYRIEGFKGDYRLGSDRDEGRQYLKHPMCVYLVWTVNIS